MALLLNPVAVVKNLQRVVIALVGHFRAFLDPVAQVQPRRVPSRACPRLPQHRIRAERAALFIRIEEGIYRRQPVRKDVGDCHPQELVLEPDFVEDGMDMLRGEKIDVLLGVGVVHAAARMARGLIALIQVKMFRAVERRARNDRQILVVFPDAALPAIGAKALDGDAHRNAGIALAAMRPVDEVAAAPKAEPHETRVLAAVERLARIEKQRCRGAPRQVAARMRHRKKYFRRFQVTCHAILKWTEVKQYLQDKPRIHPCESFYTVRSGSKRQRPGRSGCLSACSSRAMKSWRRISSAPRLNRCAGEIWQSMNA